VKVIAKLGSGMFPGETVEYSIAIGQDDVRYWCCS